MESEERGLIRYVEQIDENVDMSKERDNRRKKRIFFVVKTDLKKPTDWTKYGYVDKDSVWYRSVDHIERVHARICHVKIL